ncbi:MAG: hypothetical protein HQK56_15400 [Deltaproteobacteria bacterium]|nr:hypothetical protein [Deltaproteobacteria bacterium]
MQVKTILKCDECGYMGIDGEDVSISPAGCDNCGAEESRLILFAGIPCEEFTTIYKIEKAVKDLSMSDFLEHLSL